MTNSAASQQQPLSAHPLHLFLIYNAQLSTQDHTEALKLLYHYPASTPVSKQCDTVGLCEALQQFTQQFDESLYETDSQTTEEEDDERSPEQDDQHADDRNAHTRRSRIKHFRRRPAERSPLPSHLSVSSGALHYSMLCVESDYWLILATHRNNTTAAISDNVWLQLLRDCYANYRLFAPAFVTHLTRFGADALRCSLQLYCYHWLSAIDWHSPLTSFAQFASGGAIQYFGAPSVAYLLLHEMCDAIRLQQLTQANSNNNSDNKNAVQPRESLVGMLVLDNSKLISTWGADEKFSQLVRRLCQLHSDAPRLLYDWASEHALLNAQMEHNSSDEDAQQNSVSNNSNSNSSSERLIPLSLYELEASNAELVRQQGSQDKPRISTISKTTVAIDTQANDTQYDFLSLQSALTSATPTSQRSSSSAAPAPTVSSSAFSFMTNLLSRNSSASAAAAAAAAQAQADATAQALAAEAKQRRKFRTLAFSQPLPFSVAPRLADPTSKSLLEPRIYMPSEKASLEPGLTTATSLSRSTSSISQQQQQQRVTRLCAHRHGTMTLLFLFSCTVQQYQSDCLSQLQPNGVVDSLSKRQQQLFEQCNTYLTRFLRLIVESQRQPSLTDDSKRSMNSNSAPATRPLRFLYINNATGAVKATLSLRTRSSASNALQVTPQLLHAVQARIATMQHLAQHTGTIHPVDAKAEDPPASSDSWSTDADQHVLQVVPESSCDDTSLPDSYSDTVQCVTFLFNGQPVTLWLQRVCHPVTRRDIVQLHSLASGASGPAASGLAVQQLPGAHVHGANAFNLSMCAVEKTKLQQQQFNDIAMV